MNGLKYYGSLPNNIVSLPCAGFAVPGKQFRYFKTFKGKLHRIHRFLSGLVGSNGLLFYLLANRYFSVSY